MEKSELMDSVLSTIAYVLIFVSIDYKLAHVIFFQDFAFAFLVAGMLILMFNEALAKRVPIQSIGEEVVQVIGYVFLFLGFKSYVVGLASKYWIVFLVIGVLLYGSYKKISVRLVGK